MIILFLKSPFWKDVVLILHVGKKRGGKIEKANYDKSFSLVTQNEALDAMAQGKV